jgi:ribosomal-protein-alanine N-acetyltransferase
MGVLDIRRMTEKDIDLVWSIEKDLFSIPWSKTSFLYEVSDNRTCLPVVALEEGTLAGYAVAWFIADELHLGNIAVARKRQGKGIGKLLLEYLLDEASRRQVRYATLEVRVSNVRAISLYRLYGFDGVAIRKGYYSDNGEDALVMLAEMGRPRRKSKSTPGGKPEGGEGGRCTRV